MIKRKITRNDEFKKVFLEGKRIESNNLIFFFLRSSHKFNRLGVIVKKEIGKAVVRNKAKRQIREAYRHIDEKLFPGYDIIIIAKKSIVELDCFEIYKELESLFTKEGFLVKENKFTG